jgi:single-stranded DNA-binding protein
MININEILLVGQTGKDSKLTEYQPKGKTAFKALREMLWNALTRGARVLVQGRLTQRQYKVDGNDMNFTEVQTNAVGGKIVLLDKNNEPLDMQSNNSGSGSGTEMTRDTEQPQYRESKPVVDVSDMEVIPH